MVSGLNKIRGMMYRLDEGYRQSVLLESDDEEFYRRWISELNEYYKESGDYGRKLYHRAGMHSGESFENVVRSICKNGLSVGSSTDGDGIGKCIWFSSDFEEYGKNGDFVLSIELTGENKVKFEMNYDGRIGLARKDIPFEYLTVEVIPLFSHWGGYFTNRDFEDGYYKNHYKSILDVMFKMANNGLGDDIVMFIDAWNYMGVPYDIDAIKQCDNIRIEEFGLR